VAIGILRRDLQQRYNSVSHFDQSASTTAGTGEPAWRSAIRSEAFEAFSNGSMPTQEEEIWRYVDLVFSLDDYRLPAGDPVTMDDDPLRGVLVDSVGARLVNGEFVGDDQIDGGLQVTSLRRALIDRTEELESVLGRSGVPAGEDLFAAASAAFGGGGVFIHADRRAAPPVVSIDVRSGTHGVVSFPTIVLSADEQAELSVVVHLRSNPDDDVLVIPHFSVVAGDGARVSLSVVQNLGYEARSIGSLRAIAGNDSTFRFGEVGLGGRFARLHLDVGLEGRGSSANVVGAYFGEQRQVLDYRYFMRHIGTNTRSDMFLKGAVEDEARSVFTGMIRIEETGQKTEAYQTNRNLILSEGASAQSVPNLEILANDVRCGHGSTVGPLDADQRYYLMSRGLDPQSADRLQMRGFFEEALEMLPHPELAVPVRDWINRKYEIAQAEGRV
jgi:Fe-S cluster assembly protein SufD